MRRGNSKNYVSDPMGRVVGAMPMRSVAWRHCRRDWKVLLWRSRLLRRNKNKFMMPVEIRKLASMAAQCRDLVKRRVLAQKARREFDARVGALPFTKSSRNLCGSTAGLLRTGWSARRFVYTARNAMTTNQRCRKNKLNASEYSDVEVTARLIFKVGECRSQLTVYFVRAGRCRVANPMARLTAWLWRC